MFGLYSVDQMRYGRIEVVVQIIERDRETYIGVPYTLAAAVECRFGGIENIEFPCVARSAAAPDIGYPSVHFDGDGYCEDRTLDIALGAHTGEERRVASLP